MVLGIGKIRREASGLLDGGNGNQQGSGFNGYPDVLTKTDFNDGGSSTVTLTQNEWVQVDYFSVPAQEQYIIGSKDPESEEVGSLLFQAVDSAATSLDNHKVRFGYTTRAGRNSDYVFSGTVNRLDQTDVEDRVQLAPQPWGSGGGKAPTGRGSPARAQEEDRIVIEMYAPTSGSDIDLSNASTYWELPIEFTAE